MDYMNYMWYVIAVYIWGTIFGKALANRKNGLSLGKFGPPLLEFIITPTKTVSQFVTDYTPSVRIQL